MQSQIYVIGHVNPDTDSIASAMGYAWLLRERDGMDTIAHVLPCDHCPTRDIQAARFEGRLKPDHDGIIRLRSQRPAARQQAGKTDQEFATMIERVVKRVMSQQLSGSPG